MVNHEWSMLQLRNKAEAYCATAEHCLFDVRIKLQLWGATAAQTEDILTHLQDSGFVDEKRYSHAYAHDKLLYHGWGRMKIRAQLLAKQLPTNLIEDALNNIDETEYTNVLQRIIASKKRSMKSEDTNKLIRFCLHRGFTYDEIKQYLT